MKEIYKAPCGDLLIEVMSGNVIRCSWISCADTEPASYVGGCCEPADCEGSLAGMSVPETDRQVMALALRQLEEYFSGRRAEFELPLSAEGTPFRKKVWECLKTIPFGEVVTYSALAERCGCHGGQRAVACACGSNRIAVILPCHRVVGCSGSLGGYTVITTGRQRGAKPEGLAIKRFLLNHEKEMLERWRLKG